MRSYQPDFKNSPIFSRSRYRIFRGDQFCYGSRVRNGRVYAFLKNYAERNNFYWTFVELQKVNKKSNPVKLIYLNVLLYLETSLANLRFSWNRSWPTKRVTSICRFVTNWNCKEKVYFVNKQHEVSYCVQRSSIRQNVKLL